MNALAPAAMAALQRWPVLERAFRFGVRAEIAPGLVALLHPQVRGDRVYFPISASGEVQTAFGPVSVQGTTTVSMHVDSFGQALDHFERAGVLPRISQLVSGANAGRPLLMLPR